MTAIALVLGGCTADPTSTAGDSAASNGAGNAPLQVVTTILPITQFTQAVVGDRAEVRQLLPNNVGPHDYQAKPADVQAIAAADLLVKNGLGLETFLAGLIENADNTTLVTVDSSAQIATLINEDADHNSHDGSAEPHKNHEHGDADPHVWLDPKRAVIQVETIRDALVEADPAGEAIYIDNAAAYIAQLQALDRDITEQLAPYTGQTYISFHDVTAYFADSYGLTAEFLVDIPEENPSPEDVRHIIETVEAKSIDVLLSEPQAGEDAFAALAKDLDVEVSLFDPMETGDALNPDQYLAIMRRNATQLERALDNDN